MRYTLTSALILAAIVAVSGCKSNSTSPNSPPPVVYPNPGSYYIVQNTITDILNKVLSVDTMKETVLATNVSIYGQTGVTVMLDSGKGGWRKDTAYYIYEANGDLLSYQSLPGLPFARRWVTFPCGSQTWFLWFRLDTIEKDAVNHDDTASHFFVGADGNGVVIFTINGQTVGTEDAYLSDTITDTTTGGRTATDTIFSTIGHSYASALYDFAPTLGYFAETDGPVNYAPGSSGDFIKSDVIDFKIE